VRTNKFVAVILGSAIAIAPMLSMAQEPKLVLEEGTQVELVLSETISSADERVGNTVGFEVVEDIKVGDTLVIPRGSTAWGTVTAAEPKKRMGRGGKLDVNIDKVRLADGEKVLLSAVKGGKGGGHTGAMVGAMVVTSLVIWPAAPFFLLMHGKDITIPKGTKVVAYVRGDANLDPAKFMAQNPGPKTAAPVAPVAAQALEVPSAASTTIPSSAPAPTQSQPAAVPVTAAGQSGLVSADPQPQSLGEAARINRERKAQQQQSTQAQTQPQ
jgi:hypothetical protein